MGGEGKSPLPSIQESPILVGGSYPSDFLCGCDRHPFPFMPSHTALLPPAPSSAPWFAVEVLSADPLLTSSWCCPFCPFTAANILALQIRFLLVPHAKCSRTRYRCRGVTLTVSPCGSTLCLTILGQKFPDHILFSPSL